MLPDADHIIALADAYRAAAPMRETALSSRLFGESKKLGLMRAGGDITVSRYGQVLVWFSMNWPAGAVWPEKVPRPGVVA